MIVTKKGIKGKGLGVSFSTGVGFEKVNKLPVMQNSYGGGYSFGEATINGKDYKTIDYDIDKAGVLHLTEQLSIFRGTI